MIETQKIASPETIARRANNGYQYKVNESVRIFRTKAGDSGETDDSPMKIANDQIISSLNLKSLTCLA
jgi:hypothetical protein